MATSYCLKTEIFMHLRVLCKEAKKVMDKKDGTGRPLFEWFVKNWLEEFRTLLQPFCNHDITKYKKLDKKERHKLLLKLKKMTNLDFIDFENCPKLNPGYTHNVIIGMSGSFSLLKPTKYLDYRVLYIYTLKKYGFIEKKEFLDGLKSFFYISLNCSLTIDSMTVPFFLRSHGNRGLSLDFLSDIIKACDRDDKEYINESGILLRKDKVMFDLGFLFKDLLYDIYENDENMKSIFDFAAGLAIKLFNNIHDINLVEKHVCEFILPAVFFVIEGKRFHSYDDFNIEIKYFVDFLKKIRFFDLDFTNYDFKDRMMRALRYGITDNLSFYPSKDKSNYDIINKLKKILGEEDFSRLLAPDVEPSDFCEPKKRSFLVKSNRKPKCHGFDNCGFEIGNSLK